MLTSLAELHAFGKILDEAVHYIRMLKEYVAEAFVGVGLLLVLLHKLSRVLGALQFLLVSTLVHVVQGD